MRRVRPGRLTLHITITAAPVLFMHAVVPVAKMDGAVDLAGAAREQQTTIQTRCRVIEHVPQPPLPDATTFHVLQEY